LALAQKPVVRSTGNKWSGNIADLLGYVFLLYPQPDTFSEASIPIPQRKDFNLTQFVNMAGLGVPIAGNTMLVGDSSSGAKI